MKFSYQVGMCEPNHYLPLAIAAEEAGFDGITIPDSICYPEEASSKYPYNEDGSREFLESVPFVESLIAVTAMAAVTKTLRFTCGVYVLPLRNPHEVARASATLAILSDNRFILGIGVGWMREEFDIYGVDFRKRGKITDEMIEVLHKLWTGEMVEHHSKNFSFPRVQLSPAAASPPPIYVGGTSDIALRRAARAGNGYIGAGTAPEDVKPLLSRLDELRSDYKREHLPFEAMLGIADIPSRDLYQRLAEDGLESTVAPPFQYALGKKHSTLDEKKRFMEDRL